VRRVAVGFLLAALSWTTVHAQGGDASDMTELRVKTEFFEALARKKWKRVETIYETKVVKYFPGLAENKEFLYRYSNSLFLQGKSKFAKAQKSLEKVLAADATDVNASFLLARILAASKKDEQKSSAKDFLLNAAKYGFPVLRSLKDPKLKRTFGYLMKEPKFILNVMRMSSSFPANEYIGKARNPFQSPAFRAARDKEQGEETGIRNEDPEQAEKLKAEVAKLLQEIEQLLDREQLDQLLPKFQELNKLMTAYKKLGTDEVERQLAEWAKQTVDYKEVQTALRLQVYINKGNEILRRMSRGLTKEKFADVFSAFQEMTALVDKMRTEEREEFPRNADALFYKAKTLNDQAEKRKIINELALVVTGIVTDARPGSRNSAIISTDGGSEKIYYPGQPITDEQDVPIAGLQVKSITEGAVKFLFRDTEFVRELTPPAD